MKSYSKIIAFNSSYHNFAVCYMAPFVSGCFRTTFSFANSEKSKLHSRAVMIMVCLSSVL